MFNSIFNFPGTHYVYSADQFHVRFLEFVKSIFSTDLQKS